MGHNGIEFGMERKLVTAAWAIGNKRNTWKKEEESLRYIEVLSLRICVLYANKGLDRATRRERADKLHSMM